jgi:serine/threonine protein kinase
VRAAEVDDAYEEHVWGTVYYVAPEKIQRKGEDFHSDMYSLGGTLYHALTGHAPFEAATVDEIVAAHVHTPLTPPNLVVPEITELTSNAIVRAMAKEPGDRFESYEEMQMALEEARSHLLVQQVQQAGEQPQGKNPGGNAERRASKKLGEKRKSQSFIPGFGGKPDALRARFPPVPRENLRPRYSGAGGVAGAGGSGLGAGGLGHDIQSVRRPDAIITLFAGTG